MKGLIKYLSPFAPDQAGVSAVLYELGGIIIICDAGGCTGNICGFDEPRWFQQKCAMFSAGLRDMDAILGRDDRLIDKLKQVTDKINANFVAIVGTPVPAVIGTDYRALKRMIEKRIGIPALCMEATGTRLYDEGEEETWLALMKNFVTKQEKVEGKVNILGLTPQEVDRLDMDEKIREVLLKEGEKQVTCLTFHSGFEGITKVAEAGKNIVVSPAALKAAKYLKEEFQMDYEIRFPYIPEHILKENYENKKVLIVHQQVWANSIREEIEKQNHGKVTVGSFFMMLEELKREGDLAFKEEGEFIEQVLSGDYDVIIGDSYLKKALKDYKKKYIPLGHFAVSGKLDGASYE